MLSVLAMNEPMPIAPGTRRSSRSVFRGATAILAALLLAACGTEDLYTNLSEAQANEMLGLLLARSIDAQKRVLKEDKFAVAVPREQFSEAVDLLKWYGIPKEEFSGIGSMFQKSGIVSSPSEERIRFMYGLSQNIAETLSQIDGVITARVNLVLPNNDPYTNVNHPSSASVFLKFRPGVVPSTLIPQIKTLVMNSVEGLKYDNISVSVMQSENTDFYSPQHMVTPTKRIFGIQVSATSATRLQWIVSIVGTLAVGATGVALWLWWKVSLLSKKKPEGE